MSQSDHLPQPATEASRAVWARVMNREVMERWTRARYEELVVEYMKLFRAFWRGKR